jgi:predicted aspartyl protease
MRENIAALRAFFRRGQLAACALALAPCAATAAAAPAPCPVVQQAEVQLHWDGSGWLAPVTIDGVDAPFLLDTGAERSMIFKAAADQLHIRRDEWASTATRGVGGIVELPNADPRSLTLGGLPLRRRTIAADNTLTVAESPSRTISGLLGQDFLSPYDVELDGPAGVLRLYSAAACLDAASLPWTGPRDAIRARRLFRDILVVPVTIDGKVLQAEIDTGAGASAVTATGMFKLGLTDAALRGDVARDASGIGGRAVPMRLHRFAHVTVGSQDFVGQSLWIGPIHLLSSIDMLLGADWLRGRALWLSFTTDTVFVTRTAGSVPFGRTP